MNISMLLGDWPFTETRSLDPSDPRLDEIVNLAHGGDYAEASERSAAVLAEGILDIRVVCFHLYGAVWERGLTGLADALPALRTVLQRHWEFLSPLQGLEKHVSSSLSWLLRQSVEKTLRHEEERRSVRWAAWTAELDRKFPAELAEATDRLRDSLQERLGSAGGPLFERLDSLRAWLDRVGDQFDASAEEQTPIEVEIKSDLGNDIPPLTPAAAVAAAVPLELGSSYHLDILIRKLAAFERLVEAEKFSRAALLMDDINATLSDFDPRLFFPLLFQRYCALLVQHIGEISGYEEYRGSPEWQAMQDLLKVDIDGFVEF
jgi:hypothetical protein